MANAGSNTNAPVFHHHRSDSHLDGKHVVFGQVIKGMVYKDSENGR